MLKFYHVIFSGARCEEYCYSLSNDSLNMMTLILYKNFEMIYPPESWPKKKDTNLPTQIFQTGSGQVKQKKFQSWLY